MFIELETIFNIEGASKDFSYEFTPDDCDIIRSVNVDGCVRNRAGIVLLEGNARFTIEASCDRCAADVKHETVLPFEHTLVSKLNDDENCELYLVEDMHFNLDELIREDILLSLPTKILCREDCKGLCPYCGANLNEGKCDCKKPIDPRLEALKKFLE